MPEAYLSFDQLSQLSHHPDQRSRAVPRRPAQWVKSGGSWVRADNPAPRRPKRVPARAHCRSPSERAGERSLGRGRRSSEEELEDELDGWREGDGWERGNTPFLSPASRLEVKRRVWRASSTISHNEAAQHSMRHNEAANPSRSQRQGDRCRPGGELDRERPGRAMNVAWRGNSTAHDANFRDSLRQHYDPAPLPHRKIPDNTAAILEAVPSWPGFADSAQAARGEPEESDEEAEQEADWDRPADDWLEPTGFPPQYPRPSFVYVPVYVPQRACRIQHAGSSEYYPNAEYYGQGYSRGYADPGLDYWANRTSCRTYQSSHGDAECGYLD